jgi:hypothetical protein
MLNTIVPVVVGDLANEHCHAPLGTVMLTSNQMRNRTVGGSSRSLSHCTAGVGPSTQAGAKTFGDQLLKLQMDTVVATE